MRYILTLEKHDELSNKHNSFVIPPGTELFHGTGESFLESDLRPGGYDGLVWTADNPGIAQTYIPVSGSETFLDSRSLWRPSRDPDTRLQQKQLGIIYDYDKVEFDNRGEVRSYPTPDVFKDFWDDYKVAQEDLIKKEEEKKSLHAKARSTDDREERRKIFTEINEKDDEIKNAIMIYHNSSTERKKNIYVNNKLEELGYEPRREGGQDENHSWRLKVKRDVILPADFRDKGRLFILTPKEEITLYDFAGDREGDLMNLEYHRHDVFEMARKNGYDGIRINDFAQVESEGNFGHISYGLFKDTLKKFNIKVLGGVEHPTGDEINRMYRSGDWTTKEYLEKFGRSIKNKGTLKNQRTTKDGIEQ
jgi:hypothetical protein